MTEIEKSSKQTDVPASSAPSSLIVPSWWTWTVLAGIAAGVFLLYGRTLSYKFTQTDDVVLLEQDAHFLEDSSRWSEAFRSSFFRDGRKAAGYYRPLVTLTFMIDAQRGEGGAAEPTKFHATNVLLHGLAVALLFFTCVRLGAHPYGAAALAAIMVAHPMTVEAVAWIPGRIDILLAIFAMLSLLALERWLADGRAWWLGLHAGALMAALFSKEAAAMLPVIFAFYIAFLATGDPAERRRAFRSPFLWASWTIPVAIWWWMRQTALGESESIGDKLAAASENAPAMLIHLGKLLVPIELDVLATVRDSQLWGGIIAMAVLAGLLYWTKNEARRSLVWGMVWVFALLLPTLLVSDFLILENRLYLPLMGLLLALPPAFAQLVESYRDVVTWKHVLVAGCFVGAALSYPSASYAGAFKDPKAFTAHATRSSPHLALGHTNAGVIAHEEGNLIEAEKHYLKAISLDENERVAHNNLGLIVMARGDLEGAEREFRKELAVNPNYHKAHFNLGLALRNQGRVEEAVASFEKTLEINPENIGALGELFRYYAERGDDARAGAYSRRMEQLGVVFQRIDPNDPRYREVMQRAQGSREQEAPE